MIEVTATGLSNLWEHGFNGVSTMFILGGVIAYGVRKLLTKLTSYTIPIWILVVVVLIWTGWTTHNVYRADPMQREGNISRLKTISGKLCGPMIGHSGWYTYCVNGEYYRGLASSRTAYVNFRWRRSPRGCVEIDYLDGNDYESVEHRSRYKSADILRVKEISCKGLELPLENHKTVYGKICEKTEDLDGRYTLCLNDKLYRGYWFNSNKLLYDYDYLHEESIGTCLKMEYRHLFSEKDTGAGAFDEIIIKDIEHIECSDLPEEESLLRQKEKRRNSFLSTN